MIRKDHALLPGMPALSFVIWLNPSPLGTSPARTAVLAPSALVIGCALALRAPATPHMPILSQGSCWAPGGQAMPPQSSELMDFSRERHSH